MAKGQVKFDVVKTNDDKLLLQVQEPDPVNRQVDNHLTVHPDVDDLLKALKVRLMRGLQ